MIPDIRGPRLRLPLPAKKIQPWEGKWNRSWPDFTTWANPDRRLNGNIVTLVIGNEQRLFAAHEEALCVSPFFASALRTSYIDPMAKRIALPDEEPEIFSSVLEFLYKGDYYPRLVHNKRRNSYELEVASADNAGGVESTVYHRGIEGDVLKDTVIYCAAEKYGLSELKKLALRKQGLRKFLYSCRPLSTSDRSRIWNPMQHHLGIGSLCLCQHSRHRFQAPSTLSCSHYPLS